MGCRCCKMIQSYLFDPAQVPSPGYVNEVSSCQADEDDTVKLKSKQRSEILVQTGAPEGEGVRAGSGGRVPGPQGPCSPHPGPLAQEDAGGGHCAEKPGGAVNGLGPTAVLQPGRPHQGDRGSWASSTRTVHPTQPFLQGGDTGNQDSVSPASEEPWGIGIGDARAPSKEESFALPVPDRALQIPAPDYPGVWSPAIGSEDREKDCLFKNHKENGPLAVLPRAGAHDLSWDSLNEAVTTEVLSIYLKEQEPAQATPMGSRKRWEDPDGPRSDSDGELADEDEAVAEALAALEAATAGEDVDEAE